MFNIFNFLKKKKEIRKPGIVAISNEKNPNFKNINGGDNRSTFAKEMDEFINSYKQKRYYELVESLEAIGGKRSDSTRKIKLKLPLKQLMGFGNQSEQTLMAAFGWYWEPLLHDLAFFEEMRDSVSLIDGQIQKLIDLALDGLRLYIDDDEDGDVTQELQDKLFDDQNVNMRESIRRCMTDLFTLGNCYTKPEWTRDENGKLIPLVIRPIRANSVRKLRDDTLATMGYVQLLHRPSEFIMGGTPHTPTIYTYDEILCGIMRSYGWYAYGKPLGASLPFVMRLKLQMERDLAEMLHQHLPRILLTWSPGEQMNQDQVNAGLADLKTKVQAMRPTDQWVTTPDVAVDYKGPMGHALDFSPTQRHIEEQLFYVLPFAPSTFGLDSKNNPFDSQQHWTITVKIANNLRSSIEVMFAPMLRQIADDWGCGKIELKYNDLDPEMTQKHAETDEYVANNAILKRDAGFIDQDKAAQDATKHHPDGPVKKAAEPGPISPPIDPNAVKDGGAPKNPSGNKKVRKKGPKGDGTKVPDKEPRAKGRRHARELYALTEWALLQLEED